ncbi:MAG TPA: hypothetical protein VGK62_07020, partial [Gaiellaceae bacterium]
LLCLLEATQAHTYKGVSMSLKVVSTTVGIIGVAAAIGVLSIASAAAAACRRFARESSTSPPLRPGS